MNPSVEIILVLLIVGAAVVALGRRFCLFLLQSKQGGAACGSGCGDCDSKADAVKSSLKPLVQLDLNADKPR